MPNHDFTMLFEQYPVIIDQMPEVFTSHEFILRLAQQNQVLYIEALCDYRDSMHRGSPTPFRAVHQILSQRLSDYTDLVTRMDDVQSVNIFGQPNACAQWEKL